MEPKEIDETTDQTAATADQGQMTQESGQTDTRPHPLEEGGERFEEVYRRMKEAEARETVWRERVTALESKEKSQETQQQQAQQTFYTAQQLQGMVDAGRVTSAQMSDQLAWQRAELAKRELKQEFQAQEKTRTATQEIRTYLDRVPSLANQSSPEFTKVARVAWEIGDELGLPVSDPRVQRRALREVFGTPEKLTETGRVQEFGRTQAATHTEISGGGQSVTGKHTQVDPLKDVDQRYLQEWERLGYTRERMIQEAKYIKRPFPGYRESVHGTGAKKVTA